MRARSLSMLDARLACHLNLDGDPVAVAEVLRQEGRAMPFFCDSGPGMSALAASS